MKKLVAICIMVLVLFSFVSCESLSDDDWFNIGFLGGWWFAEEFLDYEPDNNDKAKPAIQQRAYVYSEESKASQ